jgi:hypothetical protein
MVALSYIPETWIAQKGTGVYVSGRRFTVTSVEVFGGAVEHARKTR